jgi:hypothetical protein
MKLKNHVFAGAFLCSAVSLVSWAQEDPSPTPLDAEKVSHVFNNIQVQTLQHEPLGRVVDLGVDLINGRIVVVFVVTNDKKIVAVPPHALVSDPSGEICRIAISVAEFNNAPGINLEQWSDWGQGGKIAAAYRHFNQETYFLEERGVAEMANGRTKVVLGYVERSSKITEMPVGNHQGVMFGRVWSLTLNLSGGRIDNVIILGPGNFQTKSVVPAMALSFNATRDQLLLDDTREEFADEPRYVHTPAAFGQKAYSEEESYKGKHSAGAVAQGDSYRDIDRTFRINQDIRTARVNGRNVQVGTKDGRVTLRGWVYTEAAKTRIGEIAFAASRLELVDNQIMVGRPVTVN